MEEVYIHIGYPKCGSTFLQNNVFPYMEDVNFIHKNIKNKYKNEHIHFVSLCELKEGKNLISSEALAGSWTQEDRYCDGFEMADRLKALYPNAKIIVILREKEKWLKSFYQQFMVDAGKNVYIKDYDDWFNNHFNQELLRFDEHIKYLKKTFDDVLVLDFKDLKKDNDKFIQKICDFMDIEFPKNYVRKRAMVGLKPKHFKLIRILGKLGMPKFNRDYMLGLLRRINQ